MRKRPKADPARVSEAEYASAVLRYDERQGIYARYAALTAPFQEARDEVFRELGTLPAGRSAEHLQAKLAKIRQSQDQAVDLWRRKEAARSKETSDKDFKLMHALQKVADELPTFAKRMRFARELLWPQWNAAFGGEGVRRCEDCGKPYEVTRRKGRFCSDTCSARQRNRGVQRAGNGKSSAENAIARREQWWKRHKPTCGDCRAGRACATAEAKLQMMARLPSVPT